MCSKRNQFSLYSLLVCFWQSIFYYFNISLEIIKILIITYFRWNGHEDSLSSTLHTILPDVFHKTGSPPIEDYVKNGRKEWGERKLKFFLKHHVVIYVKEGKKIKSFMNLLRSIVSYQFLFIFYDQYSKINIGAKSELIVTNIYFFSFACQLSALEELQKWKK